MKYILVFLLVFMFFFGCVSLGESREDTLDLLSQEVHEGMADGYRGPIRVQVGMNAGVISEIIILDDSEDRFVGGAAIEELIDSVIEINSTDVDVVTGATLSSKGFLDAVNNAIMGL